MSQTATKRLQADFKQITEDPPPGVHADLSKDNLFEWDAIMFGPADTPYEGGSFRLKLKFPTNYPERPPDIWFYSYMFHPNVYADGKICLDIKENWKREYNAVTVLVGIQTLLGQPNPKSPANVEATWVYEHDKVEYERRIKQAIFVAEDEDENVVGINMNVSRKANDLPAAVGRSAI